MKMRSLLMLVMTFALAACSGDSGTLVGPDPGQPEDPEPAPEPSVPASIQLSSPQDTISMGQDTAQLSVVVRDEDGNKMEGVGVGFESSDPDILKVLDDGRVVAPLDTVFYEAGPSGGFIPHDKVGTIPESEGPKTATIRVFVKEDRSLEAEIGLVQNSPITYLNLRPDGTCMAVGYYTTGERIHTDATAYARDFSGRRVMVGPDRLTWEAEDPSIIDYEIHPDDYQTAKVWGIADGKTYFSATVAGLTNKLTVLSSTKTDEHGNVSCDHLQ